MVEVHELAQHADVPLMMKSTRIGVVDQAEASSELPIANACTTAARPDIG